MKNIIITLLVCSVLVSCASKSPSQIKAVSYFQKPGKGLESIQYFPVPESKETSILASYEPITSEDMIYFPTNTRYKVGTDFQNYSTIFAIDSKSMAVKDSLDFRGKGKTCDFHKVLINKDIYVIGIKDSLCIVYQTDKSLKILKEYETGIKAGVLLYAAIFDDHIRLVLTDKEKRAWLYDLNAEQKPGKPQLLFDNSYQYTVLNTEFWFLEAPNGVVKSTSFDLSQANPAAVRDTYEITFPKDTMGAYTYKCIVTPSTLYFAYSRIKPEGGFASHLIAVNRADKKTFTKDIDGIFSFDILDRNGKTYLYGMEKHGNTEAFLLTEMNRDLTFINKPLSFYFSDSGIVNHIVALRGNTVILTGGYAVRSTMTKLDEMIFPLFMAKFELE